MATESTPTPLPSTAANDPSIAAGSHTYDGISEYDNPTPMWWNLIFIGSILFAPAYILWFHSPQAEHTISQQYKKALAENLRLQFGELGELKPDESTLLTYMNDDKWQAVGAATFATNCKQCHGADGEGISAPNLTDDYYLNVKQIADIAKVIDKGAKNGAMPAWGQKLHPTELVLTAAYVASLRGKNLSSARKAEGDRIDPWPPAPKKQPTSEPTTE